MKIPIMNKVRSRGTGRRGREEVPQNEKAELWGRDSVEHVCRGVEGGARKYPSGQADLNSMLSHRVTTYLPSIYLVPHPMLRAEATGAARHRATASMDLSAMEESDRSERLMTPQIPKVGCAPWFVKLPKVSMATVGPESWALSLWYRTLEVWPSWLRISLSLLLEPLG
jgi:hypothetical protein